jgi:hypothetical protein
MRSKLRCLLTVCLSTILCLILIAQPPAQAGPRSGGNDGLDRTTHRAIDDAISRATDGTQPGRIGVFGASLTPSEANPVDSQPDLGESIDDFRSRTGNDGRQISDRERRDTERDVTGERHIGGGGSLDR